MWSTMESGPPTWDFLGFVQRVPKGSNKIQPFIASGKQTQLLQMAIEIVSFPIKNGWIFPQIFVCLPEGSVHIINFWLVVYLPIWKIWLRQLGLLCIPNIWKVIKFHGSSHHQSVNVAMSHVAMSLENSHEPGILGTSPHQMAKGSMATGQVLGWSAHDLPGNPDNPDTPKNVEFTHQEWWLIMINNC